VVNSVNPAANGGKAKSANAIVIKIDHVKIGRRVHVTPFARFFTIVVIKLIEDMVTETANKASAKMARVAPGCGENCIVFRGA
jgi:hypothetical protein